MASSTSPDGIVYPDASDPIAPLNAVFQDLAESVQDALDARPLGAEDLDDLGDVTITTPADGQVLTYDNGTSEWVNQALTAAQLPTGSILQVVSVTKTDTFSVSGTTFADVTDLSVAITPSSATSKLFITFSAYLSSTPNENHALLAITDGANNDLYIGDTLSNRSPSSGMHNGSSVDSMRLYTSTASGSFLIEPATTSSFTVKGRLRAAKAGTAFLGQSADLSQNLSGNGPASITVMEVAG